MSQKSTDTETFSTLNVSFTMKSPKLISLQTFFAKFEKMIEEEEFCVIERMRMDYIEGQQMVDLFVKE